MPAKQLLFGSEARSKVFRGVTKLAEAVRATLGPKGRNVLIEKKYGGPVVTKDGVSVAKEVELEDTFENMGAQLVKQAAEKTNDAAGDGTTTATVLAQAMMEEGIRHLSAGSNAIGIKNGMMKAVRAVADHLELQKKVVSNKEEYAAVAAISAQDDGIGKTIAEVIEKWEKKGSSRSTRGRRSALSRSTWKGCNSTRDTSPRTS